MPLLPRDLRLPGTRRRPVAGLVVMLLWATAACSGNAQPSGGSLAGATSTAPMASTPSAAAGASPAPTPAAANPSPYPAAAVFVSPLYGYSMAVPAGWTVVPATIAWDGTSSIDHAGPTVDQLLPPEVQNRCTTAFLCAPNAFAYALPSATSLAAWVADGDARDHADHPCPAAPESSQDITIDGKPAILESKHCEPVTGILVLSAAVVSDGVGYAFAMQDFARDRSVEPLDRSDFLAMLAAIHLPG